MDSMFLLLQINDSLFPIGAYSHSWGLETYIQKNLVNNAKDVEHYIRRFLRCSFLCSDFLTSALAHRKTCAGMADADTDPGSLAADLLRLEEVYLASRLPSEIRSASEKLGNRFMKLLLSFPDFQNSEVFAAYSNAHAACAPDPLGQGCSGSLRAETAAAPKSAGKDSPASGKARPFCHPVAYGLATALAEISEKDALSHYLYTQSSLMITTCVKTIPISQTDGQKILFSLHPLFDQMLAEVEALSEDDLCLSAPGFDLRCMQHEKLYSRLYMS